MLCRRRRLCISARPDSIAEVSGSKEPDSQGGAAHGTQKATSRSGFVSALGRSVWTLLQFIPAAGDVDTVAAPFAEKPLLRCRHGAKQNSVSDGNQTVMAQMILYSPQTSSKS